MTTKTVLIVEDDFLNRRLVKKTLYDNGYDVLEAKNAAMALSMLSQYKVDFILLDINLGEGLADGISLGQEIIDQFAIPFLYLTAYDNRAVMEKAIATAPYGYITKPFKSMDLIAAVALGIRQSPRNVKSGPTIKVKHNEFMVDLPIGDIHYIEADRNYLLLNTPKEVYKIRSTIKQIMEHLPSAIFVQIHRAFIVNRKKIDKFNVRCVLVNNKEIPVSRKYVEDISMIIAPSFYPSNQPSIP
ncbi:LytR/AlgR family response regulator transcription factor [Sphingobacterium faecale]|uniref:Response regulator transcription factor n=1 Tax=Sphingobacterium faecale TaxID=2803775 RepID=A0ABS1R038_9SPHI|nr:response regulator transcription factor [Sphingobacterium faecale]MBL1408057.1 response regulator transcription factor [Sphingobacterium faecale]